MTKKKMNDLKKLYYTKLLYEVFINSYIIEGSRGYRPDLRSTVESNYSRFVRANEQLREEDKIESAVKLQLTA